MEKPQKLENMPEFHVDNTVNFFKSVPWLPYAVSTFYTWLVFKFRAPSPHRIKLLLEEDMADLLTAWNVGLSMFSIWGWTINWPFLTKLAILDVCGDVPETGIVGYSMAAFAISKFVELGDTLLLALRNRRISFLHAFHHATVLVLTWTLFVEKASVGPVFVALNYGVHSLLYPYYVAIGLPNWKAAARKVAPFVTAAQVLQMVAGCVVVFYAAMTPGCRTSTTALAMAGTIYLVYLGLFSHLYFQLYIADKQPVKHAKTS